MQVVQVTSLVKYSNSVVDVLSCFTKVCVSLFALVMLLLPLPFAGIGILDQFHAFCLMQITAEGSVFGAVSLCFLFVCEISREPLNGFAPNYIVYFR